MTESNADTDDFATREDVDRQGCASLLPSESESKSSSNGMGMIIKGRERRASGGGYAVARVTYIHTSRITWVFGGFGGLHWGVIGRSLVLALSSWVLGLGYWLCRK